ncbi:MAG: esterase-like activity of phytase family protein [Planctomycetales bacterium]
MGSASLPGDGIDRSELTDVLENGVPHNRLGGISAIEYSGQGTGYLLLPDRGPADGATRYHCRYHRVELSVDPAKSPAVVVKLQGTTFLKTEEGNDLTGSLTAFDRVHPERGLRFDPEGLRLTRSGTLMISDEYGPVIAEFQESGKRMRTLKIPAKFQISHPASSPEEEATANSQGRQPNGGMEGLALTPDGKKLLGAMQRPLIQDSLPGKNGKRIGLNCRLLEFDLDQGGTREFLYRLDETGNGLSEILAVDQDKFLVIERDGKAGTEAVHKKIYAIDRSSATDIGGLETVPAKDVPKGVVPVKKKLLIDLLDPRFGMSGSLAPEKIEGLAFGPALPDGSRLLVVAIDNDFVSSRPILFCCFSVSKDEFEPSK